MGWRKLQTKEIRKLHPNKIYSNNKIQKNEMGRACSKQEGEEHAEFWVGKPE